MDKDKRLTVTVPLIGMNEQWEERYLNDCVQMGADSVFLMAPYDNIVRSKKPVRCAMFSDAILPPVPEQRVCDLPSMELVSHWADVYRELAPKYRAAGMEPYFWLCHTIGHGGELSTKVKTPFQALVGTNGKEAHGCYCPLDSGFRQYLLDVLATLAAADIPLILLDDDFRINYHEPDVDIGCFCPLHIKRFNEEYGTQYSREELSNRVFNNIGNTRAQFMKSVGDSMLELAADMEKTVHSINPNTRLGLATAMIHYSTEGYEIRQLAKALAGPTWPYIRVFGAPYHVHNDPSQLGYTVDTAKHFAAHFDNEVEIISEGDTFPHSRFFTNQTVLETYLLAARCAGIRNMLHYPFPFAASPDYEPIYVQTAQKLTPTMELLDRLLPEGMAAEGVAPVMSFHNFANVPLSERMTPWERAWPDEPIAVQMLTQYGIPTVPYRQEDTQPVFLAGHNACDYTPQQIEALLDRGAILDATAAAWLLEKGHDIGLESIQALNFTPTFEQYCDCPFSSVYQDEQVWLLSSAEASFFRLQPKSGAMIAGYFIDGESGVRTPSCVAYSKGNRKVFVLGVDLYQGQGSLQVLNNVARGEQLRLVSGWLGACAYTENHAFLYTAAYRNENYRTICLVQTNMDPCREIDLYLHSKPAGPVMFYSRNGQLASDALTYTVTQNGRGYRLHLDHTMMLGDLLMLTYPIG